MLQIRIRTCDSRKKTAIRLTQRDMLEEAYHEFRDGDLPEIFLGPHGKPYFEGTSSLHFNFSDSYPYIVLAISDAPVGIDLQERTTNQDVCLRMARRFFPAKEAELVAGSDDPVLLFHRLWTIREAYVKYTGDGLFVSPMNAFAADLENRLVYSVSDHRILAAFQELTPPDPSFCLTLCHHA